MMFQNDTSILGALAGIILFTAPIFLIFFKYQRQYEKGEMALSKRYKLIYGNACLFTNFITLLFTVCILAFTGWSCLPGHMKVSSVKSGSAAFNAGIQSGDTILPQNGIDLNTLERAPLFLAENKDHQVFVSVDLKRGNEILKGVLIQAEEVGPLNIQSLGIRFETAWHPYQSIGEFASSVYESFFISAKYTKDTWLGHVQKVSFGPIDIFETSHRFVFTLILMSSAFTPIALLIIIVAKFCCLVRELFQKARLIEPQEVQGNI